MSRLNCNSVDTRSYINDRKFVRNIPSKSMANHYIGGPVPTRYINMPIIDCRKESNEKKATYARYNQHAFFNPGSKAPYEGYADNVDNESKLFNQIHPLQNCPQNTFIPDSKSELYNQHNYSNNMKIQFKHINKKEHFKPFNPNSCNLGTQFFNNHTRQQTKDL